jgi:hypothetical protein
MRLYTLEKKQKLTNINIYTISVVKTQQEPISNINIEFAINLKPP